MSDFDPVLLFQGEPFFDAAQEKIAALFGAHRATNFAVTGAAAVVYDIACVIGPALIKLAEQQSTKVNTMRGINAEVICDLKAKIYYEYAMGGAFTTYYDRILNLSKSDLKGQDLIYAAAVAVRQLFIGDEGQAWRKRKDVWTKHCTDLAKKQTKNFDWLYAFYDNFFVIADFATLYNKQASDKVSQAINLLSETLSDDDPNVEVAARCVFDAMMGAKMLAKEFDAYGRRFE